MSELEQNAERVKWFGKLAVPSLVYAAAYTVFTYDNDMGLGILAWILATICYVLYLLRASDIRLKKGSGFYLSIMGLLGLSTILTSNYWLIFCNNYGFRLLLIYFLLVQTQDTERWSIWEALSGIFLAVIGSIGRIAAPFAEGYSWLLARDKSSEQAKKRRLTLLGIAISIPALLILGSLLMRADAVFCNLFENLFSRWTLSAHVAGIAFTFLFGLFASYCGMHYILDKAGGRAEKEQKKQPALIAQIFTTAILILYVCFCMVQIIYLFGGFGTLPEGMTYAQYARSGFFQLLYVCVINLILVLTIKVFFETTAYLNYALLGICLCSYIMTASSAYRMILYIQVYDLTVLRIVVLVALAAIAILLAGICRSIFHPEFRILTYCVVVIGVVYTLFSFSHVERFVVRYDLARMTEDNATETFQYLETLSLDALPAALRFLESADANTYAADMRTALRSTYTFKDVQTEEAFAGLFASGKDGGWLIGLLSGYEDVLTDNGPRTWNLSVQLAKNSVRDFFLKY